MTQSVLIVDDHAGFRSWTRAMLEAEGYAVIAEAGDGASALAAAAAARPDLVLLDVMLPDISGIAVARQLAELERPPAVILTSSRDPSDFGDEIERSSALGFIPKPDLSGQRLRAVLAGGS